MSTRHSSSRGGVSFNLDTIAASRRAMISGKVPSTAARKAAAAKTSTSHHFASIGGRPLDLETGEVCIPRKIRTKGTDPTEEEDRKHVKDESDEGSSSSGSESESDSSYDSIEDMKQKRKPYVYALLGVVSLLLLGGIIALSVVIFGGKDDESPTPILTSRQESLHNIITSVVPSDTLTDSNTPQYRAHQWLLYEDSLGLAPDSGASKERVIQRYALATFYFSTGGPRSWKTHNWLEGDECTEEWDGVGCTSDGRVHVLSLSTLSVSLCCYFCCCSCFSCCFSCC